MSVSLAIMMFHDFLVYFMILHDLSCKEDKNVFQEPSGFFMMCHDVQQHEKKKFRQALGPKKLISGDTPDSLST